MKRLEFTVAAAVFLGAALFIFVLWLDPAHAWLYPEVIPLGRESALHSDGLPSFFMRLFDWKTFDINTQRMRIVNDGFEITDAALRPLIAQVFAHPTLSLTQAVFAGGTVFFMYKALRAFSLSLFEALVMCAVLLATPGFLSNVFIYIHPAKPISFVLLSASIWLLARNREREFGISGLVALAGVLIAGSAGSHYRCG